MLHLMFLLSHFDNSLVTVSTNPMTVELVGAGPCRCCWHSGDWILMPVTLNMHELVMDHLQCLCLICVSLAGGVSIASHSLMKC